MKKNQTKKPSKKKAKEKEKEKSHLGFELATEMYCSLPLRLLLSAGAGAETPPISLNPPSPRPCHI